jgi:hypothetical protein
MKNSSDIIGNRSRDLPVCSAVPQPLRHRLPHIKQHTYKITSEFWEVYLPERYTRSRKEGSEMKDGPNSCTA